MSNEITTLGDALNYLGIVGGLVAVAVAVIVGGAICRGAIRAGGV
jgi:hypothetical protein